MAFSGMTTAQAGREKSAVVPDMAPKDNLQRTTARQPPQFYSRINEIAT